MPRLARVRRHNAAACVGEGAPWNGALHFAPLLRSGREAVEHVHDVHHGHRHGGRCVACRAKRGVRSSRRLMHAALLAQASATTMRWTASGTSSTRGCAPPAQRLTVCPRATPCPPLRAGMRRPGQLRHRASDPLSHAASARACARPARRNCGRTSRTTTRRSELGGMFVLPSGAQGHLIY
jgi:hypothetical protein